MTNFTRIFQLLLALSLLSAVVSSPVTVSQLKRDGKKTSKSGSGSSSTGKGVSVKSKLSIPKGTTTLKHSKGACSGTSGKSSSGKSSGSSSKSGKKGRRAPAEIKLAARATKKLFHVSSEANIKDIWTKGIDWDKLSVHRGDFHGKPGAAWYLGDDRPETVKFCGIANRPCDASIEVEFDESASGVKVYRFKGGKDGLWKATINFFKYAEDWPAEYATEAKTIVDADVIIGPIDSPLVSDKFVQYAFRTENSIKSLSAVETQPKKLEEGSKCVIMRDEVLPEAN